MFYEVASRRCCRSAALTQAQVEPQEKKKTPKGRAKKRLTYTRRFVNVTMTGGKRKVRPTHTLIRIIQTTDELQMNPNPGS